MLQHSICALEGDGDGAADVARDPSGAARTCCNMWRRNNDRFGCAPTARWVAALGSPKALAAMNEGDIEANRGDIFQAIERPKDVQRRLDPDSPNNYGQGGCRLRSTAMFHVAWIGLATM